MRKTILWMMGMSAVILLLMAAWLNRPVQSSADSGKGGEISLLTDVVIPTPQQSIIPPPRTLINIPTPPVATFTPFPTVTALPTALPTATPTNTPTATATNVPTLTPSPTALVRRPCPETAPLKPEYNRFWLGGDPLPRPAVNPEPHFWLGRPIPSAGRLLTSNVLPYGYDGQGRYLLHNGTDISQPLGTPLLAVADGTVVVAQKDDNDWYGWRCDWYGELVVIELDATWQNQPIYALYGHVLEIQVEAGQRVVQGQQVAEVGVGGAAVLPHLHFELRVGENNFENTRNPLLWFAPSSSRGILVGRLIDERGRPWQGYAVNILGRSENTDNKLAWTYLDDPQHIINSDEGYGENFVMADLKPGEYEVQATIQGQIVRTRVVVVGGEVTTVELVTLPLGTVTPES